ncbi:hypothetical protein FOZ63_027418, partial [Perkinsus olseni]
MSAVAFAFDEAFFYALLLIVGGAIGFVQAKSKPSLIAGPISGVLVFAAAEVGSSYDNLTGLFCLAAIALILTVFFYSRYVKTRKFMPGGLMCVISALSFCVYFYAVVVLSSKAYRMVVLIVFAITTITEPWILPCPLIYDVDVTREDLPSALEVFMWE